MCMEQYYRLFSSYRRPGIEKDNLVSMAANPWDREYILVMCRGQCFVMEVSRSGSRLREDDFFCQLRRVARLAAGEEDRQPHIGLLTSMKRDLWAQARENLAKGTFDFQFDSHIFYFPRWNWQILIV